MSGHKGAENKFSAGSESVLPENCPKTCFRHARALPENTFSLRVSHCPKTCFQNAPENFWPCEYGGIHQKVLGWFSVGFWGTFSGTFWGTFWGSAISSHRNVFGQHVFASVSGRFWGGSWRNFFWWCVWGRFLAGESLGRPHGSVARKCLGLQTPKKNWKSKKTEEKICQQNGPKT